MSGFVTVSIGSGLVDSIYGNCQVPIKSFLEKQGEAFEQQSLLKVLFREQKSNHWAEGYTGETAMENFEPVGEGGAYPTTGFQEAYKQTIENEEWKQSFSVTQTLVEDNQLGEMKSRANKLITAYDRTREQFGRMLYAGALKGAPVQIGKKSFKTTSADGVPLFSKEHVGKVDKKKQTNLYAGEFSAEALDAVETEMQNAKGDNGQLLAIAPDTIWIPNDAALKRKVFEVIGADKDPSTSNNGFNYQFGRWNVICDPYLTLALNAMKITDKPWILLDSKFIQVNDGAIFQNRINLQVRSEIDPNNDNNVWKGRARFSGGFVDWRFAAAGGMTGGTALT